MRALSLLMPSQFLMFLSFVFLIVSALLAQTTVWFGLLGWIPCPNLWIPLFVYLMLNREKVPRILWFMGIYLLILTCTVASPMSTFLSLVLTFYIIHFLQSRFSTLSIFDLVLLSSVAIVTFPLTYALFLWMSSLPFSFDWLGHFLSLLLSLTIIPALLMLCRRIDRTFNPHNSFDDLVLEL